MDRFDDDRDAPEARGGRRFRDPEPGGRGDWGDDAPGAQGFDPGLSDPRDPGAKGSEPVVSELPTTRLKRRTAVGALRERISSMQAGGGSGTAARTAVSSRVYPDPRLGLSADDVQWRIGQGLTNVQETGLTPSVPRIFLNNFLTLFNLIILFLAVSVTLVGRPENALFFGVAICNTGMGVFQELRAKRTLDKLSILAQAQVTVLRDGGTVFTIPQEQLVLDDIVLLATGDQVCADGVVIQSEGVEVDESLLTGESERIAKQPGQTMLSGSFVTAGRASIQLTAVGAENYANSLAAEAKGRQKDKSRLLRLLNLIIKVLTVIIIPMGLILFFASISQGETLQTATLGAAAAMVGMIPSGLVLLTGVTLTLGALTLARRKALVQSLYCIETLARTDVLCLDKTGTITDGSLSFDHLELMPGFEQGWVGQAVAELMGSLQDDNATAKTLREAFGSSGNWQVRAAVPFSSDRKWSGAEFEGVGSCVIGAPNLVLSPGDPALAQANRAAAEGYRVVCLAHSMGRLPESALPSQLRCAALFVMSDSVREDAVETFRYFADEGMIIKVISGDNPATVSAVAAKAGLAGAGQAVDMARLGETVDLNSLVEENTVFGHTSPQQKLALIQALQENGHVTCMTGDGVNDILAMRQSDSSVAMVSGSSAARNASDFVLMADSFASMINVLKEGRRVINNIERVASLYLVSTIFSVVLSAIYTFLTQPYPYMPLQMTPVNMLTIGIPTFFLALRANFDRPVGRFFENIFENSVPAGLTIVINTLYIQLAGLAFKLSQEETSTMVVFLAGAVGFFLLVRISAPYSRKIFIMLVALISAFVILFLFLGSFFLLGSLLSRTAFFYLPLLYFSFHVHEFLSKLCHRLVAMAEAYRERLAAEDA